MFNLQIFKPKGQDLKERVLRNKEALLDVMAQSVQGGRTCPLLMGQKCIGAMCEHFLELQSFNRDTGTTTKFWRCAHVEQPLLLMEQNQILRSILNELMLKEKKDA